MTIFQISATRFAVGTTGKVATYVVSVKGKKVTGVRGRRPLLTKNRYKMVTPPAAVREAFRAALA